MLWTKMHFGIYDLDNWSHGQSYHVPQTPLELSIMSWFEILYEILRPVSLHKSDGVC